MDYRFYRIAIDLINLMLGFLAVYAVMFTVMLLTHNKDSSLLLLVLSFSGILLSYSMRQFLKHIWSFLFLHVLLLAALFVLVPSYPGKILCVFYMACTTIFHLIKRLNEEELRRRNTNSSLLLVLLLLYIINLQLHLAGLTPVLFKLAVVFILLFLINSYLINFEHYFSLQQETSNIPIKQIKTVNHTIIVFFLGMSLTSMLIFTRLPIKEFLLFLRHGALIVLRAFFSLFPNHSDKIAKAPEKVTESPVSQPFQLPEASDPSPVWNFIQNLITNILIVSLIVAAIALLCYSIYKFYQAFYKEKRSFFKDNAEFISPFEKKENKIKESSTIGKRSFMTLWKQTNNDKIRKLFYKAILSKREKLPPSSSTPVELSQYILSNHSSDEKEKDERSKALAYYYEKARYYNEECRKEDVDMFKQLLR